MIKNKLNTVAFIAFISIFFGSQLKSQKNAPAQELSEIIQLVENKRYYQAKLKLDDLDSNYVSDFYYNFYRGITELNLNVEREASIDFFKKAVNLKNTNKIPQNNYLTAQYYLAQAYFLNNQIDTAFLQLNILYAITPSRRKDLRDDITGLVEHCLLAKEYLSKPQRVTVHNLSAINSEFNDHSPVYTADELELAFTSTRGGSTGGKFSDNGEFFEDIYIAFKHNSRWTDVQRISEDINTNNHESDVWISLDGQEMFIYRSNAGNGDIFSSELQANGNWSKPLALDFINTDARETSAFKTYDGRYIFFTSDRKNGEGGLDIYVVEKMPNGHWGDALNLGSGVNTSKDEENPYFHPNGNLYFSSKGHKSMGGFDIYVSKKEGRASWTIPKNMGYPINSVDDDMSFNLSIDGLRAYLASSRKGGKGHLDIYFLRFNRLYKTNIALVSGVVKIESGYLNLLRIEIKGTDFYGVFEANLSSGQFIIPLKYGQEYTATFTAPGNRTKEKHFSIPEVSEDGDFQIYTLDTTYLKVPIISTNTIEVVQVQDSLKVVSFSDLVLDIEEESPTMISSENGTINMDFEIDFSNILNEKTYIQSYQVQNNKQYKQVPENLPSFYQVSDIPFNTNDVSLSNNIDMNDLTVFLKQNGNTQLKITGHADASGNLEYNYKIAYKRANQVYRTLIKMGVDSTQLLVESKGEMQLLINEYMVTNKLIEKSRAFNRRVELSLIEPAEDDLLIIEPLKVEEELVPFLNVPIFGLEKRDSIEKPEFLYSIELISSSVELDLPKQIGAFEVKFNKTKFGVYVYSLGQFTTKEEALFWLREIKKRGFTMAKLVLESQKDKDIGYYYSIHLLMSEEQIGLEKFKGVGLIIERKVEQYFHYYYGQYLSLSKAEEARTMLVEKGFKDAFIFINDYSDVK